MLMVLMMMMLVGFMLAPILMLFIKLVVYAYLHLLILFITVFVCKVLRLWLTGMMSFMVSRMCRRKANQEMDALRRLLGLVLAPLGAGRSLRQAAILARRLVMSALGARIASPPAVHATIGDAGGPHVPPPPCLAREVRDEVWRMKALMRHWRRL